MKNKIIKTTKPKTTVNRNKNDTWYYTIDDKGSKEYYVIVYKGDTMPSKEYKDLYDSKISENKELFEKHELSNQFYTYHKKTGELIKFYSMSLTKIDELVKSIKKKK